MSVVNKFLTRVPRPFSGERIVFSTKCWDNWITTCERMNLEPYLTSYIKINSKWIKDLNVRAKTVKLKEENRAS